MEWFVAQTITLVVILLLHFGCSLALMFYRRRKFADSSANSKRSIDGTASVTTAAGSAFPPGVLDLTYRDRSAQGVGAKAGDKFFRNYFSLDGEGAEVMIGDDERQQHHLPSEMEQEMESKI